MGQLLGAGRGRASLDRPGPVRAALADSGARGSTRIVVTAEPLEALYPLVVMSPDRQPYGGRPSRPRISSTSGLGALGGAAWRRSAAAASAHDDPRLGDGPPRRPTGAGPGPPAGGCSPRRAGFLTAVLTVSSCQFLSGWPAGLGARQVPGLGPTRTAGRCLGDDSQSSVIYGSVGSSQVRLGRVSSV